MTTASVNKHFTPLGIVFEAYSPLGNPGFVGDGDKPRVLDDTLIKEIAAKHEGTAAQVSSKVL